MVTRNEMVASVLQPHFDAVKDTFAAYRPSENQTLRRCKRTKLLVDPKAHDTERHFAACREDGMLIILAPQAVDLPHDTLVAILAHEFGHAVDFLYPGHWDCSRGAPARWIVDPSRHKAKYLRSWQHRDHDRVEHDADLIAEVVTGMKIGYCGPCVLQCFGGSDRPKGLR